MEDLPDRQGYPAQFDGNVQGHVVETVYVSLGRLFFDPLKLLESGRMGFKVICMGGVCLRLLILRPPRLFKFWHRVSLMDSVQEDVIGSGLLPLGLLGHLCTQFLDFGIGVVELVR